MKTMRMLPVLLAVTIGGMIASPAHTSATASAKVVSFKGHYSGTASLLINGNAITIQSVKGKGSASIVGAGSIVGTGSADSSSGQACVPFKGTGSMKGASGTIKFSVTTKSQGCGDSATAPVTVSVTGFAKVTGGSGKAKGAKGTLSFTGTLNLNGTSGAQSGAFSGKLSGKLTVAK